MTIEQFHREFKVFFDKADSLAYPEFLDGEIDIYLNEAQNRIVKLRYGKNNAYVKGFEESQKRTDDLKNLVKTKYCSVQSSTTYQGIGNVYTTQLTQLYDDIDLTTLSLDKYQFYIKSTIKCVSSSCTNWNSPKITQQDDIYALLSDPFNKPRIGKPLLTIEDNGLFYWLPDGSSATVAALTFLKEPNVMNKGTYGSDKVECELSNHIHKELLQLAIQIALENIQSPRVQSQAINIQTNE
jgi:hypothetical protein